MKNFLLTTLFLIFGIFIGYALNHIENNQQTPLQTPDSVRENIYPIPLIDSHIVTTGINPLVTIIWFGKYGDPLSHQFAQDLKEIQKEISIPLNISFRHAPFGNDKNSLTLAFWAEAAAKQGQFWSLHNALFEAKSEGIPPIQQLAENIGLDIPTLQESLANPEINAKVYRDWALARSFHISSVPALFINGHKISLPIEKKDLVEKITSAGDSAKKMVNKGIPPDQIYEAILLSAPPVLNLSVLANKQTRQQVIPRSDFPTFGSEDPQLWLYFFTSFGSPFSQAGLNSLNGLLETYEKVSQVIYLPYANPYHAASGAAAACAYWAMENNNFEEVLSKLSALPYDFSAEDFYNLKNNNNQPLCPAANILEQYEELVAAAGQLKSTMNIKSEPALLINGLDVPIIRDRAIFDSLISQELELTGKLMQKGLHNQELLISITRTPPPLY